MLEPIMPAQMTRREIKGKGSVVGAGAGGDVRCVQEEPVGPRFAQPVTYTLGIIWFQRIELIQTGRVIT